MSKNLFTLTERTTEPTDSHRIAIGTGLVNALNITWANLKTWIVAAVDLSNYAQLDTDNDFSGDITADNLSGTNTGDQDLSPFVRNDEDQDLFNNFRFEGFVKFDEPINAATSVFADNAAALAGGLDINDFYRTPTGEVRAVI